MRPLIVVAEAGQIERHLPRQREKNGNIGWANAKSFAARRETRFCARWTSQQKERTPRVGVSVLLVAEAGLEPATSGLSLRARRRQIPFARRS